MWSLPSSPRRFYRTLYKDVVAVQHRLLAEEDIDGLVWKESTIMVYLLDADQHIGVSSGLLKLASPSLSKAPLTGANKMGRPFKLTHGQNSESHYSSSVRAAEFIRVASQVCHDELIYPALAILQTASPRRSVA